MKSKGKFFAGAAITLWLAAAPASAQHAPPVPLLADMFQDHAVFQRGEPINIWGQGTPGSHVHVRFDNADYHAQIDQNGHWRTQLPARNAGGPYNLTVSNGQRTQTVSDLMVGDVYLCSGQSNMEWPLRMTNDQGGADVAAATGNIRLITVSKNAQPNPVSALPAGSQWHLASPQSVPHFSAVCYLFGLEMARTTGVTQGLISSNWGGSRIEPWIQTSLLADVADFGPKLAQLATYGRDQRAGIHSYFAQWQQWWNQHAPENAQNFWAGNSGLAFQPVPKMEDWQKWGIASLANFTGDVIFRTRVTLTAEQAASASMVHLGGMDELDLAWVNGQPLNQMFGWGNARSYPAPANIFREGSNEITVVVHNSWGAGGMFGPVDAMKIATNVGDVSIGQHWEYAHIGADYPNYPRAPWEALGGLATLHNGMIAPLGPWGMRGALWYQGESNAGAVPSYEMLLTKLFASFRQQFGADLPVFVVQLPGFGAVPQGPVESGWSDVREAMRRVVAADANSGLAVTIDVGDPADIHPTNKRPVAQRLAAAARAVIFGARESRMGIGPANVRRRGNEITVNVTGTRAALRANAAARPGRGAVTGFAVCSELPNSCILADARLNGARKIVVTIPEGQSAHARRLRYCWGDSPVCTIQDQSGQPLAPFEVNLP